MYCTKKIKMSNVKNISRKQEKNKNKKYQSIKEENIQKKNFLKDALRFFKEQDRLESGSQT